MALVASTQEDILLDDMRRQSFGKKMSSCYDCAHGPTRTKAIVTDVAKAKVASSNARGSASLDDENLKAVLPLFLGSRSRPRHSKNNKDMENPLPLYGPGAKPSKIMAFIWQCPVMLMSYSWASFVIALTLYILQPFIERHAWGDEAKV
jgi:hypothetical protein